MLLVEFGDQIDAAVNARVHRFSRALMQSPPPGLVELVPTYRSLAIHFDPLCIHASRLEALVQNLGEQFEEFEPPAPRTIEVPVVYGGEWGPDLAGVSEQIGLSEADIIALHSEVLYRVFMLGFMPGFPYLGGMSPLIEVPRLPTPRTFVPAGSVGIAGLQTGIYPTASPGGWRLIGRTPLRLFDATREPPALLEAGDLVRLLPIDPTRFAALEAAEAAFKTSPSNPSPEPKIEILDGGLLTTIQDLGRVGYQNIGVPVAGAMDPFAMRAGNRLVGNPDQAAGIEITLIGPTLRFLDDSVIAITGADLKPQVNERPVPAWQPLSVRRGDRLSFAGRRSGARAYLAFRGGIAVFPAMGSRSTFLPAALGGHEGRPLREGDRLTLGAEPSSPPSSGPTMNPPHRILNSHAAVIRVMLGPQDDAFTEAGIQAFLSGPYTLSLRADRVGYRLEGPIIEHRTGADIVSDGTAFGSIQVAGDGLPMVLMADRGTTGGYTKIATVVSADLPILAQALPGDRFRFRAVSLEEAVQLARHREAMLEALTTGGPLSEEDLETEVYSEDQAAPWVAEGFADLAGASAGNSSNSSEGPPTAVGLCAGMTGQVTEVLVAPGQTVVEQQTLLIIEAMKMKNPLRAPHAGVVRRVHVEPNQVVTAAMVLVEFE